MGLAMTVVFGAWGHILDLLVDTPWDRIWKTTLILAMFSVVAVAALPLSIFVADLAAAALARRLGLDMAKARSAP